MPDTHANQSLIMSDAEQNQTATLGRIRQRLLDLGKRNRLINYRPSRAYSIPLNDVDLVLTQKLLQGQSFLLAAIESKEAEAEAAHREEWGVCQSVEILTRSARKLAQEARTAEEETGSNLLYLTVGLLDWYSDTRDSEHQQSPLLLIPSVLERTHVTDSAEYGYLLSCSGEEVEVNPALLEKLQQTHGLTLPAWHSDISPADWLTQVSALLASRPQWTVKTDLWLDLLNISRLRMYRDLDAAVWSKPTDLLAHPQLCSLIGEHIQPSITDGNTTTHDDDLPLILDADSSQISVLQAVVRDSVSLAVEGPPGTGKSQTIANLIAAMMAQGKTVLFVAEKQAALSVVKARLDEVGLGLFCLPLHSHKTRKAQLHEDLRTRLQIEASIAEPFDLDVLQSSRDALRHYSQQVQQHVGPNGETLHGLIWQLEHLRGQLDDPPLHEPLDNALKLTADAFQHRIQKLNELSNQFQPGFASQMPHWQGFSPSLLQPGDTDHIHSLLGELLQECQYYQAWLMDFVQQTQMPLHIDLLALRTLLQVDRRVLNHIPFHTDPVITVPALHRDTRRQLKHLKLRPHSYWPMRIKNMFGGALLTVLQPLLRWSVQLRAAHRLSPSLIDWLVEGDHAARLTALQTLLRRNHAFFEQFTALCTQLGRFGELDTGRWLQIQPGQAPLTHCIEVLQGCQETIHHISDYALFNRLWRDADQLGLQAVLQALRKQRIAPQQAALHYRYMVWHQIVRTHLRQDEALSQFTRDAHEQVRERFATLDQQQCLDARQQVVRYLLKSPVPPGQSGGRVNELTELRLLQHELNKKQRHIPIRQLVQRAGAALQALKPCFMMSPLSVSHYLPPDGVQFDLLIMDEASQVRPQDALGAIARCKQVVIVGDSRQLPPTSFFEQLAQGDADESTTPLEEQESILDLALSVYPVRRLRWHYRSLHESLIAFANRSFYHDDLLVFPSPYAHHPEYGVQLHRVENAAYADGQNLPEAEAVVAAVIAHFHHTPERSLGVATFNSRQQDLISHLLERRCYEENWLEARMRATEENEPFFVKNLENVQGDERDIIFISTVYGPDPGSGRVFQRFGPINTEPGWRRLNVILTRARQRLDVFTSLSAADITLGNDSRRGARTLKNWLAWLESGILPPSSLPALISTNHFTDAIEVILHEHGYRTVRSVGVAGLFIPLAVCHPQHSDVYILGIVHDDNDYHQSAALRDRDRLRDAVLQARGWRLHRLWSVAWFLQRDAEVQHLLAAVEAACEMQTMLPDNWVESKVEKL